MESRNRYGWRWAGVLAVVALCAAGPAAAQSWLAGASAGQSDTSGYDIGGGGTVASLDHKDTAFVVFGGYTFGRNFGLMASYVDLGTTNASGASFGGFTDELKVDGFNFSTLGILPATPHVSFFALVGVFKWTQKVNYVEAGVPYHYRDSGTSASFGVGANFLLTKPFGIHVEWQRFTNVGDDRNSGHRYDRDFYSIGAVVRFGATP